MTLSVIIGLNFLRLIGSPNCLTVMVGDEFHYLSRRSFDDSGIQIHLSDNEIDCLWRSFVRSRLQKPNDLRFYGEAQ